MKTLCLTLGILLVAFVCISSATNHTDDGSGSGGSGSASGSGSGKHCLYYFALWHVFKCCKLLVPVNHCH